MTQWLNGAAAMAFVAAAVYFARFWRETRDAFFVYFALAFAVLAANRVLAAALPSERQLAVYVVRLIAFVLIAAGIVDKNRERSR